MTPAVTRAIAAIATDLERVLAGNFVGLYVFGSLVLGGWLPERSDIDFIVITDRPLETAQVAAIGALHDRLTTDEVGRRLEGEYIDLDSLQQRRFDPVVPTVHRGRLSTDTKCEITADNLRGLVENGLRVRGRAISDLGITVTDDEFRAAEYEMLLEGHDALERASDPADVLPEIVDALRCVHSLRTRQVVTKEASIRAVLAEIGDEFVEQILHFHRTGHAPPTIDHRRVMRVIDEALTTYAEYAPMTGIE